MNPIAQDLNASVDILSKQFGPCSDKLQLAGDASNRKYFRLEFENKLQSILMLIYEEKGPIQGEITAASQNLSPSEQFIAVQNFLFEQGLRVPKILAQHDCPKLILLEDLGDDLLFNLIAEDPSKLTFYYQKALEQLSELVLATNQLNPTSFIKNRSFDHKLWMGEFEHFVECALDVHLNLSNTHRQELIKTFEQLSEELSHYPQHLCHRDYHARNLIYLPKEQQFAIIDFQDALMAPLTYDIASLLRDAYFEIPKDTRYTLLEFAYQCALERRILSKNDSYDEFQYQFDLVATHRNLKAAGRFFYIDQVKGNPNYLKDIPLCLNYIQDTLEQYSDLKQLKNLLEEPIAQLLARKELYQT
ncbi:phosphotransferase [bacterium]|nr:phosphotransferase [bacterium]